MARAGGTGFAWPICVAPPPRMRPLVCTHRSTLVLGRAAQRLFISEATVKTHLIHIYAKPGANDRVATVAAAFDRGC